MFTRGFYRISDFEALAFYSDMDEGWEGHALIVEEQFKEEFIVLEKLMEEICLRLKL